MQCAPHISAPRASTTRPHRGAPSRRSNKARRLLRNSNAQPPVGSKDLDRHERHIIVGEWASRVLHEPLQYGGLDLGWAPVAGLLKNGEQGIEPEESSVAIRSLDDAIRIEEEPIPAGEWHPFLVVKGLDVHAER